MISEMKQQSRQHWQNPQTQKSAKRWYKLLIRFCNTIKFNMSYICPSIEFKKAATDNNDTGYRAAIGLCKAFDNSLYSRFVRVL